MLKILTLKRACLILLGLFSLVSAAPAQVENAGEYNTWSKSKFARKKDASGALTEVRAARNDGYDRAVFVFKENVPTYEIEFVKPPFYSGESDVTVKVRGKKFVRVSLVSTSAHDIETGKSILTYKKGYLGLPVVEETAFTYDFEGAVEFIIGLKANKDFRVIELKNPSRLVIDFKH